MPTALTPQDPWEAYARRGRWRRVTVHPGRFQIACATDISVKATAVAIEAGAVGSTVALIPQTPCVEVTPMQLMDGGSPSSFECGAAPFGLHHF